ncbi:MAG: helix-turn-helix domain-containing protein [Microbacterium sp.]
MVPTKRTYAENGDACATAHAIELLGDRWTYPIIRELMLAPKRFGELEAGLRGVTPAVLTARLRELEATGLVRHATPRARGYELTDWARELEPTLAALGRWAHASPTRSLEGAGLTPDGAVQSMTTMAPPGPLDPGLELQLQLFDARAGDRAYDYAVSWDAEGLHISRGENPLAAATVRVDSSEWAMILHAGRPLAGSDAAIDGDAVVVQRVVGLFAS